MGAKIHGQEGNNPDRKLRSLSEVLSEERRWERLDNQKVGLEAAIL